MFNYRQPSQCRMAHDQDNPCLSDEDYPRYELTDTMGISSVGVVINAKMI